MVLTRAFACALPVVASDITGYRDVITTETAVAVPPGDPAALAAAVSDLLEDEPRRLTMAAAGRALAQERYGWQSVATRLLEIYEFLVERERTGAQPRAVSA
jgi:glycosyltransferase involved in cell wall biosynthesis